MRSSDTVEQTCGGRLDHIKNVSKALGAAEIGVRHLVEADGGRIIEEELELGRRAAGTQPVERRVITPVHGQHVIEVVEIAGAHLARAQAPDIDAALRGLGLGAGIGGIADVIIAGTRGIDPDQVSQTLLVDEAAKDAVGHRRAADITETHEQNLDQVSAPFGSWGLEGGLSRMMATQFKHVVILTGAGVSAESGLGTFRDKDGLWTKYDLNEVATPEGFARDPVLVHEFYNARRRDLLNAAPNPAHHALARLEQASPGEVTLITQNVDDLHERAGSRNLIHMHGELLKTRCARSGHVFAWTDDVTIDTPCPACAAVGSLRPHVVWFGEMPMAMGRIEEVLDQCDLFLSIGTSGAVYPAAGFVEQVRDAGRAHTVELNLEPSEGHSLFAEQIYGPAGQVVPAYVERLLNG